MGGWVPPTESQTDPTARTGKATEQIFMMASKPRRVFCGGLHVRAAWAKVAIHDTPGRLRTPAHKMVVMPWVWVSTRKRKLLGYGCLGGG